MLNKEAINCLQNRSQKYNQPRVNNIDFNTTNFNYLFKLCVCNLHMTDLTSRHHVSCQIALYDGTYFAIN